MRYPLILLIALNAAMLTILYGLCEYLVLTVYAERFPDERALTQFLAIVFAGIQALEFALLYVVSRPLLERAGPVARNLVFPISSLVCLIGLVAGPKLPAAIVTHVNAEAVSNAIFQPVNNTNYLALPLRFHGRIRTLADGVFYPSGLALAGLMLLSLQDRLAAAQINFVAITFALLFIALNVGAGVLFLPALVRNLRSDIAHFADAAPGLDPPRGVFAEQIGSLLRSDDPETRSLGLGLASRVDPAPFLEELRRLAPAADRPTRRAIAGLLARAPPAPLARLLDELLDADDPSSQLIALQVKLVRGDRLGDAQAGRLAGSPSRSVAALVALVARRPGRAGGDPGLVSRRRDRRRRARRLRRGQAGRPGRAADRGDRGGPARAAARGSRGSAHDREPRARGGGGARPPHGAARAIPGCAPKRSACSASSPARPRCWARSPTRSATAAGWFASGRPMRWRRTATRRPRSRSGGSGRPIRARSRPPSGPSAGSARGGRPRR